MFKVYGKPYPNMIPNNYQKMMAQVLPASELNTVPWDKVIPAEKFEQLKLEHEAKINSTLNQIGPDIEYYQNIYSKTKSVFEFLQPAKVDIVKYKLHNLNDENVLFLQNWKYDSKGYLPVPEYSLCDTVTGRMKIKTGPNILLLPKKLRNIITSRFGKKGSIWYLDYTSLEPRVALSVKSYISSSVLIGSLPHMKLLDLQISEPMPKDVYSLALKTLKLSTEIDRDTIKQIVLSQIYGQSKSHTIETLEKYKVRDPDEVVEMVNEFFGIDNLRQFILEGFQNNPGSFLRTFYGRHLTPEDGKPHALLNYYIQSTAVDVALLGFEKILRYLEGVPDSLSLFVPIFFLHDAMILDVHQDVEHLIPKLCNLGSKDIPGFKNQMFWMTGNKL